MKLNKINTLYFLGIGGIGMSALARFFLLQKKQVYGYDLTPSEITSQLIAEGAHIHFEDDVNKIPKNVDIAIYSPAVPKENAEFQYFLTKSVPMLKRSEILGMICHNYPIIAIAGTHGKTTTTAMVTQMLCGMGYEVCGAHKSPSNFEGVPEGRGSLYKILSFIGGIAKNFNSNFVYEPDFDTVIVEADEFDRSFLTLHPQVAIITSIDADHLDVYGSRENMKESFQLFANQIKPGGTLVIYDEIAEQIAHPNKITYGFSDKATYNVSDLPHLPIPGKHNALNATAAFAACCEYLKWKNDGIVDVQSLQAALSQFTGVKRRFDVRVQRDDFVYIDDYAHHPEAINAFLDAVKNSYPTKKIIGIFQPHLYSRTKDFAQEFAESLEILDEIILLDIYPAREEPIEGISSSYLLSLIKNKNKKLLKKEELIDYLQENKPDVLLTMGAGDIDRLVGRIENVEFF